MKHLALALILATGTASAGTVLIVPNSAGGGIMLTDEACPDHEARSVSYIKEKTGAISGWGCYFYATDDEMLVVVYNDGTVYSYPLSEALVTKYGEKKMGLAKPADPVL